jgi:phosphosulfolactate synthase
MMNYNLSQIPERTTQPRQHGLTMVMDKGLEFTERRKTLLVLENRILIS